MSTPPRPLVLAILDGWGNAAPGPGNAIERAATPNWERITKAGTLTELAASGEAVGLPKGVIGNSEVGHINIGSGRVVPQGLVVINESIGDGSFAANTTLADAISHVKSTGGQVHLLGLLSDGCVHSSIVHLEALVEALVEANAPFAIHAIGDGRDVPPSSMAKYLANIEGFCDAFGRNNVIATICGRFYTMDRDNRWERTQTAYTLLTGATSPSPTNATSLSPTDVLPSIQHAHTASEALQAAYARGETDEFLSPTIIGMARQVGDGDVLIFFNFRPDRARQITLAFTDPQFAHFPVTSFQQFTFISMTRYDESFTNPILFGPRPQADTFGEIVSQAGLKQLRLAETEKYAHVTYFFNGGREQVFAGEDRILLPSDRSVATYDLAPAMQAQKITSLVLDDLAAGTHQLIVLNYANADMVGHTGKLDATIASIEILDTQLGRLCDAVLAADGILAITADHGNAEEKLDPQGNPLTAHTTNPVPFVLVAREALGTLEGGGALCDIAPTLLPLLGLEAPQAMTGRQLLTPVSAPAMNA